MKNEPVAWMDYLEHSDVYDLNVSGRGIPLYTHEYERPHNTVLVPCDKLAEMQAEIEALKSVVYWLKENRPEVWDDIQKWRKQ